MLLKALPTLFLLVAVPAFAAPPVPVKSPPAKLVPADPCAMAMGANRGACLAPVLDAATQSLDATIAQLKTHFEAGKDYATLFDASQDSWVKAMAQTCHAAEQFYDGGSISHSIGLDCQLQMTRDREKLIKSLYDAPLYH